MPYVHNSTQNFIPQKVITIHTLVHKDSIYIYLVDLVSEKVDKFRYTLHDYLKALLAILSEEADKQLQNAVLIHTF